VVTRMVRAYWRQQLFFVAVSLSWLGPVAGGPAVDPVTDQDSTARSLGFAAGSLALWLALLVGGLWVASTASMTVVVLALFGWGFLVAPLVVVLVMRTAFPRTSGRLQAQLDALERAPRGPTSG
jgi:hypothetical protein